MVSRIPPQRFEVRLARHKAEVQAAQRLRYQVFYEEMGARAAPETAAMARDCDLFDSLCDHLLVIDHCARSDRTPGVVGTYRLTRRSRLPGNQEFYTESEFDLCNLKQIPGEIVELGRSCVHPEYRNRAILDMLWRGLGNYIANYDIRLMFGCASFPGTDPDAVAEALAFLDAHCLAPETLRPRARHGQYISMRRLGGVLPDRRRALRQMPPLIRGYLSAGCHVGDGAVIDTQFNTTDICVMIETENLSDSYARRYQPGAVMANAA